MDIFSQYVGDWQLSDGEPVRAELTPTVQIGRDVLPRMTFADLSRALHTGRLVLDPADWEQTATRTVLDECAVERWRMSA